jgi:type III secretory pathway component EscU
MRYHLLCLSFILNFLIKKKIFIFKCISLLDWWRERHEKLDKEMDRQELIKKCREQSKKIREREVNMREE